jgi:hypothetical protein
MEYTEEYTAISWVRIATRKSLHRLMGTTAQALLKNRSNFRPDWKLWDTMLKGKTVVQ